MYQCLLQRAKTPLKDRVCPQREMSEKHASQIIYQISNTITDIKPINQSPNHLSLKVSPASTLLLSALNPPHNFQKCLPPPSDHSSAHQTSQACPSHPHPQSQTQSQQQPQTQYPEQQKQPIFANHAVMPVSSAAQNVPTPSHNS